MVSVCNQCILKASHACQDVRLRNSSKRSVTLSSFHNSSVHVEVDMSVCRDGTPACSMQKLAATLPHRAASTTSPPLRTIPIARPPRNPLPPPVGSTTLLESWWYAGSHLRIVRLATKHPSLPARTTTAPSPVGPIPRASNSLHCLLKRGVESASVSKMKELS